MPDHGDARPQRGGAGTNHASAQLLLQNGQEVNASLIDAFLDTDSFLRHCGLSDTNSNVTSAADLLKQDRVARSASSSAAPTTATTVAVTVSASEDGGATPTNFSPLVTPKIGSPNRQSGDAASGLQNVVFSNILEAHLQSNPQSQQLQGPQMRQNSMDLFLQDLLGGGQSSEPKRDQHCCSNDGYQSEVSSNASSVGSESSSGWINNSRQQHSANTSVDNGTPYGMEVDVKSEWDESWDLLGCDKGTDTCQPCQYHQNNKHGNHHLQHFMQYYGHNHQYQFGSGTVYGMEDDVKLEELEWDQSCLRWFGDSYQYHQQCDQSRAGGSRHVGTFRALSTGLEPIPENDVTSRHQVFQPLVPPAVPMAPATTSYNISFPTTLQLRPADTKLDFWRSAPMGGMFPSPSPGPGSISASPSSSCQPSPFHCAPNTSHGNTVEDLQPMNIIRDNGGGENKHLMQHHQHFVQQHRDHQPHHGPRPHHGVQHHHQQVSPPPYNAASGSVSRYPPPIVGTAVSPTTGQPSSPHHRPQSLTSQRSREKKRQRRSGCNGGGNGKSDAEEDVVDGAVRLKRKSSSEGRQERAASLNQQQQEPRSRESKNHPSPSSSSPSPSPAAAVSAVAAALTASSSNSPMPPIKLEMPKSLSMLSVGPGAPMPSYLPSDYRRRDNIKNGFEELERIVPHAGRLDGEKLSQASVLFDAGNYVKRVTRENADLAAQIEAVKKEMEDLNSQIDTFQSSLPATGATLLPKVLSPPKLADRFHDHVVARVKEDWRYWVFVHIMGHFVHSFDDKVVAHNAEALETTAMEYVKSTCTLGQLRKDSFRKLAKLSGKTSIHKNPERLPEEALGYVTRGERHYSTVLQKGK